MMRKALVVQNGFGNYIEPSLDMRRLKEFKFGAIRGPRFHARGISGALVRVMNLLPLSPII
jgi:hypothetical protein